MGAGLQKEEEYKENKLYISINGKIHRTKLQTLQKRKN